MAQKKSPSYKLLYFDGRARGELCRYIFAAAGQPYDDARVKSFADWPSFKPSTPFGQIPVLEVNGKPLAQSRAMARYLAKEFGLAGKDSWEQALVDQYICLEDDMFKEFVKEYFEEDATKKEEIAKTNRETVYPKFMGFFEKELEKRGDKCKYLVGDKLTAADLAVLDCFDTCQQKYPTMMDTFPKLKAHRQNMLENSHIKEYLKKRKSSDI